MQIDGFRHLIAQVMLTVVLGAVHNLPKSSQVAVAHSRASPRLHLMCLHQELLYTLGQILSPSHNFTQLRRGLGARLHSLVQVDVTAASGLVPQLNDLGGGQ